MHMRERVHVLVREALVEWGTPGVRPPSVSVCSNQTAGHHKVYPYATRQGVRELPAWLRDPHGCDEVDA